LVNSIRYEQAKQLRKQGKSYAAISDELKISKSTISNWFSKKIWSNKIKSDLNYSRLKVAKKNLVAANLARSRNQ